MQRSEPRFRLRLFAQEFDLRAGTTRIGRSPACEVTIDDPAISREHAVIVVDGEKVVLHDLKSRNGVQVNGARVTDGVPLSNGDRIRIGNQDLVFSTRTALEVSPTMADLSATSELDQRLTPLESPTLTTWYLELQTELLRKALQLRRGKEAEVVLGHMEEAIRARLREGDPYERPSFESALTAVLELSVLQQQPRFVGFVFDSLRSFGVVPSNELAAAIEAIPRNLLDQARADLRASHVRSQPMTVRDLGSKGDISHAS